MKVNLPNISPSYYRKNKTNELKQKNANVPSNSHSQLASKYNSIKTNNDFQNINFGILSNIIGGLVAGTIIGLVVSTPFVIAGSIYEYVVETLPAKRSKKRDLEELHIKLQQRQEVQKLVDTLHLSESQAQKYHDDFLNIASIRPSNDGHEKGLNAIQGYGLEKYELAMKVISPIIIAQKRPGEQTRNEVPNGLLLYGPGGSGKTYIADSVCEHLKHFDVDVKEVVMDSDSHTENAQRIRKAFLEAEERFKKTGKYTVIKFPEDIDRKFLDSNVSSENSEEMSAFLYRADHSASRGAIWIATANNPKMLDKSVIRRADVKMLIGNMEDFAIADMIKYTLIKHGEKQSSENLDYEKVIKYIEERKLSCTPFEYEDFVKKAIASKYNAGVQVTADMIIEQIKSYEDFCFAIDDDAKQKIEKDKKYVDAEPQVKERFWEEDDKKFEALLESYAEEIDSISDEDLPKDYDDAFIFELDDN